jgi:hypothetical protein
MCDDHRAGAGPAGLGTRGVFDVTQPATLRSTMQFRVIFNDYDPGAFGSLSFQAANVNEALRVIAEYYSVKPVELWCEGSFLGRLERIVEETGSFWRVG